MKSIPNQRFKVSPKQSLIIKDKILSLDGEEDLNIKSATEDWRIWFLDSTITAYKTGTVYVTDSNDKSILEIHRFINSLVGSKFNHSSKDFLIGFDEAGKGEVLGHIVLAGVIVPNNLFDKVERDIGLADSKSKHSFLYWNGILKKIAYHKKKGLHYLVEKITPWDADKYNLNKLMDVTYKKMLLLLSGKVDLSKSRIVFDDYGIGSELDGCLLELEKVGAEIIKKSKADDLYLESRVASLIAKQTQQGVLNAISNDSQFKIKGKSLGSGNAGDPKTIGWIKEWIQRGKPLPWFVKKSFKNIRELEGKGEVKKMYPKSSGLF